MLSFAIEKCSLSFDRPRPNWNAAQNFTFPKLKNTTIIMDDAHITENAIKTERENALALLTSGRKDSIEPYIEPSIKFVLDDKHTKRASSFTLPQPPFILGNIFEKPNFQGHLQRIRTTPSSDLQTHDDPPSPSESEMMLKIGLDHEEQHTVFFSENQMPYRRANGEPWPRIHMLRKSVQSEGGVSGQPNQEHFFDETSSRSRRLCYVYDRLRLGRTFSVQSRPSAHEESNPSIVIERPSSEVVSDFVDEGFHAGSLSPQFSPTQVADMVSQLHMLSPRSSEIPQNIGWRFSNDSGLPPQKNAWKSSDSFGPEAVLGITKHMTVENTEHIDTSIPVNTRIVAEQPYLSQPPHEAYAPTKTLHAKVDSFDALNPSSSQHRLFPPYNQVPQFEEQEWPLVDSIPVEVSIFQQSFSYVC